MGSKVTENLEIETLDKALPGGEGHDCETANRKRPFVDRFSDDHRARNVVMFDIGAFL